METQPATDDIADQEALARGYRQYLKGPLGGGREENHDIREEHAKADPGYVTKASIGCPSCADELLPTTPQQLCRAYGLYRPLLDDASCRWRAMNFPYVGTFHKFGSKDQIGEEYGSMPLTDSIETWCNHRKWIFEDIRGEVISLLTDLAATIHVGHQSDENSLILRRFSDEEVSSAIIYYFRLLASAILKVNSVTNLDLIPDGVSNFCKDMLEPPNPGVTILIDVLMNPVSIAVEIVYLNRSGTQISSHLVQAEDDNGIPINPAGPIVHLLYQPGHNDILYKYTNASRSLQQQQIIDSASAASNIQTNRAGVVNRALDPSPMSNFNSFGLSGTVNIPGLSMAALSNHGFPSTHTLLSDYDPILTPSYPFNTSVWTPNISAVYPHISDTPIVQATAPSSHSAPPRPQRTRNLQVKPSEVSPSSLSNQFRHEYKSDRDGPSAQVFQTSMFRNSHYNTAHYSNPDFQPEEWRPDDEEPCTDKI